MKDPDELEELEEMLSRFQPVPGEQFHARMGRAPWITQSSSPPETSLLSRLRVKRRLALAMAAIMILFLLTALFPPLQGMARQIALFFTRTDTDQLVVTPAPGSKMLPVSIEEARAAADFQLMTPVPIPAGFTLTQVWHAPSREAVIFQFSGNSPGKILRLTQSHNRSRVLEISSVGASAQVDMLTFSFHGTTVTGEYVLGAWRLPPFTQALPETQPDITVTLQANWDSDAKIHMLRWQSDGILYEFIHGDLSMDSLQADYLIALAQSLQ